VRSPAVADRRADAERAAHRQTCTPSWNGLQDGVNAW